MFFTLPLVGFFLYSSAVAGSVGLGSNTTSVSIQYGTVIGSTSEGVDAFKGVPYAQPPIGALRLRPPRPISKTYGTIMATATPTACPQADGSVNLSQVPPALISAVANSSTLQQLLADTTAQISLQGEDCLTLNVQRPAGIFKGAKLPVLFWIHGGAFMEGTGHAGDGVPLVQKSLELGSPVIYVSINYRLSAFGFLPGKQLQAEGSTNLGLRDQRLALEWVQENIEAFGGDPRRVTIWGESAGAWSVFDHLLVNNGDNKYKQGHLFHGAIMNSGAAYPASGVSSPKAQDVYEQIVSKAGCASSTDQLACLRSVEYDVFHNASNIYSASPTYSSLNLPYLVRPDPTDDFFAHSHYDAIRRGAYAKVPIISGNQEDEGTLFTLAAENVTTSDDIQEFFTPWFPDATAQEIRSLIATYPEDQAAGSPFGTGTANQLYSQFKRLSAIVGDFAFVLARRVALRDMACQLPAVYSYLSSYFHDLPFVGTAHGTDVALIFSGVGPAEARERLLVYYISFVNHLDPNKLQSKRPGTAMLHWPKYTNVRPSLLKVDANSTAVVGDDFRHKSFEYLSKHRDSFHL